MLLYVCGSPGGKEGVEGRGNKREEGEKRGKHIFLNCLSLEMHISCNFLFATITIIITITIIATVTTIIIVITILFNLYFSIVCLFVCVLASTWFKEHIFT